MSGLGHYLERAGIATVCIALVREHAQAMRPPRALWVPFPLGRPFGVPNDAGFQRRVLLAALALLEAPCGPVLADYDEEASAVAAADDASPVCPVSFPAPRADDSVLAAVLAEIIGLQPWYDLGRERRGRTTVGLSGLPFEQCARRLAEFVAGNTLPHDPVTTVDRLRWSAEDLKAFYMEAVTAQPGRIDGAGLARWFWNDTACARLLREVRERALASGVPALVDLGDFMLVNSGWSD